MRRLAGGVLAGIIAGATAGCVSSPYAFHQAEKVSYCAGDLVVVGRIQEQTMSPIPNDNDLLGRGHVDMVIRVKRTLVGQAAEQSILATTVAHALARKDLDFVFVLKPVVRAPYELRSGTLLFGRKPLPRIVDDCATA